jgi:lipopolysaccharide export system protein LptA
MALPIYRLRRLLAATAVLLTLLVGGMYFYARMKTVDVRKKITSKLPFEIKQTANGFQISRSDGKRTLFTVQATDIKQFKLNGDAQLHNVNIVLYGKDSSRFDQIYGDDFAYNEKSGNVTAKGEVQIDLVANPSGTTSPDQTTPKEIKNPIHLKTSDLVFNKDTGDAATDAQAEFRTAQATGTAVGVRYEGKSNTLTLLSQVHIVINGDYHADSHHAVSERASSKHTGFNHTGYDPTVIDADHGVVTRDPRVIVLENPKLRREGVTMQSDHATFYLSADNSVQRIVATDHVTAEMRPVRKNGRTGSKVSSAKSSSTVASPIYASADQGEFLLTEKQNLLRTGILTGNVHVEQAGAQPVQGDAGRVVLDFEGRNELQKVHALDGARLVQKGVEQAGAHASPTNVASTNVAANIPPTKAAKNTGLVSGPQDFELKAPIIDFTVADKVLQYAVTSGAAQITITPAAESDAAKMQRTVVTAGKFEAHFDDIDGKNQITNMHGAPDARIVNSAVGVPDRVSTSESVDAIFLPHGGIDSITQQGNVAYTDNQPAEKRTQAWANTARYTPADQMLVLTGSPRVIDGSMATTATTIRINRATGDALADGDVKSTYSDLKEQPNGALLASSSPIHVTAKTMTAQNNSGVALYTGNARLWQDANVVEAPSIQFEREKRFVTAQGTAAQPAQTILVQAEKPGDEKSAAEANPAKTISANSSQKSKDKNKDPKQENALGNSSPIAITALKLTYADSERKVHYEGGVFAKGVDFTAKAKSADAFLRPRSEISENQSVAATSPGQLDHMIAYDDVVLTQPNRHADGQKLVYTASDDKFVLTGGPPTGLPSIFDAKQGKITGVSLTFFRTDDRVLVEGEASTPVVTQTRVAR